jgi:hypothetical protein
MGLKRDIARAEAYITRANRRIGKHRHLIGHSPDRQTVATAREVVEVLTTLLVNVEHQHRRLQQQAETAAARKH